MQCINNWKRFIIGLICLFVIATSFVMAGKKVINVIECLKIEYLKDIKEEINKGFLYKRGGKELLTQMRVSHHTLRVMDCTLFFCKKSRR